MGSLQLNKLNKIYSNGFHAVHDVSLTVQDGEFIVFVGPSGCGKSTLLRMIAGLESISDGELILDGKNVNKCPPVERDIAVVFQDYALYGNMTVYDNVGMSLTVRHKKDTEILDKVEEAAGFLGLKDLLNRFPKQLSGGQKQRVALARSVVREPRVFLMDEPLSNLDAKLRNSTRSEIVKLQRDIKVTTIYVTHDQTEAMTMADRIVVIKDGTIQQVGTPEQIYNEPVNLFVAGFIGSPPMNFIDGKIDGNRFRFADGEVGLPEGTAGKLQGYAGKDIVLGFRPEEVEMRPGSEEYAIEGVAENREYLGNCSLLYVNTGRKTLICKVPPEEISAEKVYVKPWKNNLYFFDRESTKQILHVKTEQ